MGFLGAVGTCYSKMVVWKGRASRSEYWWFMLFQLLFLPVLMVVAAIVGAVIGFGSAMGGLLSPDTMANLGKPGDIQSLSDIPAFVWIAFAVGNLIGLFGSTLPQLSVMVRRLHDSGHSGWWYWIVLIPLIGAIILLILMLLPSDRGHNRFGPNPRGVQPFQPLGYRDPAPKRGWGQRKPAPMSPSDRQAAEREDFRRYYKTVVEPAIKRAKPDPQV